jgi:hypothetical protein
MFPTLLWMSILPCWLIATIISHIEVGVWNAHTSNSGAGAWLAFRYLADILPIVLNLIISSKSLISMLNIQNQS